MEFNQSFKSPSIPKLSKRTISSPFGDKSSLATPKLKKTSFSFIKGIKEIPTTIFQKPEEGKKEGKENKSIAQSLAETNKNLIEILKQLGVDFASRISQEKKEVDNLQKEKSRKRRGLKEGLFGIKAIGSGIMGQVNQILAPTKSIFDKIKEFFGIILTGIILNNAFKWLQNPANREKLIAFFKFVGDHWKEILILFGTYKLVRLLTKIIGAARAIKRLLDFFRKKPPGGGNCGCDDKKPKGGGPYDPCAPVLNCLKDINGPTAEAFAERIANTTRFRPLFALLGITNLKPKPISAPKPKPTSTAQPSLPPGVREDMERGGKTASPLGDLGIMALASALVYPIISALGLGSASTAGGVGGVDALNKIVRFSRTTAPIARADGGTIKKSFLKFSMGGTVGGRGKPKADDVPAMLSSGEEVVNTRSSMLWRPLLKDLNDNAGRLFDQFRQAVIKLTDIISRQKANTDIFKQITEEFNNYLQQQIRDKKLKDISGGGSGGGDGRVSSRPMAGQAGVMNPLANINEMMQGVAQQPPSQTFINNQSSYNIKPSSSNVNININSITKQRNLTQPSKQSKPVIIPMTAPPIMGKMPTVQTPTAQSSEVPSISSVNMANPYMQLTSRMYGIHVI